MKKNWTACTNADVMDGVAVGRELQAANGVGVALGRGTGMTFKEFNRRLNEMMSRKKVEGHAWRKPRRPCSIERHNQALGVIQGAAIMK